jgi:hypothetical protein
MIRQLRNFFNKIRYGHLFLETRRGLRSLRYWLPIIWKDRPWDWYFILYMLQKKLEQTRKCIGGSFVGSEKEAVKIRKCELLIDRIINDEYMSNPRYRELMNTTEKLTSEGWKPKYLRKKHSEWLTEYVSQDLDMLFDIMKKNIKAWWN